MLAVKVLSADLPTRKKGDPCRSPSLSSRGQNTQIQIRPDLYFIKNVGSVLQLPFLPKVLAWSSTLAGNSGEGDVLGSLRWVFVEVVSKNDFVS